MELKDSTMKDKRTLYIIGGPAKVGKSAITGKIKGRESSITPSPNDICRPIVKNIFTKEVPANIERVTYKGTITFGPHEPEEIKPFDISFPLVSSIARSTRKGLIELPTDYIRAVIRLIFVGENRGLSAIAFEGETTLLSSNGEKIPPKQFKIPSQGEDDNAWNALVGLINDYDRENQNDVLIEGVAITPERVSELKLTNLDKKAVFIGYSNAELYAQRRITYAKEFKDKEPNNYDWPAIQAKGEEQHMQDILREARDRVPQNAALKERAEGLDIPYFDLTEKSFDEHVQAVMNYLWPPQK